MGTSFPASVLMAGPKALGLIEGIAWRHVLKTGGNP